MELAPPAPVAMAPGADVAAADLELGEGCGYSAEAAEAGCDSRADAEPVCVAPPRDGPPAAHEQAAPVCRICLGCASRARFASPRLVG